MNHQLSRILVARWISLTAALLTILLISACNNRYPASERTLSSTQDATAQTLVAPAAVNVDYAVKRALAAPSALDLRSADLLTVSLREALAPVTGDRVIDRNTTQPLATLLNQSADTVLPLSRTTNVLVLGSDRRPNMPNWRTDVIMIVAMDLASGEAGVISVPRDVYIDEIPGHRPNRINVIDYLGEQDDPDGGGPALLAGIIEDKMGIHIDHYLRFDFEGFKDVIDALGGIEVTVDCPVSDYLPEEDIAIRLQPGTHRLDGRQALAYVRSRRQGGDLDRVRRQQRMVWSVRDQIQRENLVSRVPALYAALHDSVQTDISLVSAIRYVRFALALNEEDVHGVVLGPPDMMKEGWRGGMFVFVADWEMISSQVQTIFDRPPFSEANTKEVGSETNRCP